MILTTLLPAAKIPPKAWPWTTAPMYDGGNFPANPDKPPCKKSIKIIHQNFKTWIIFYNTKIIHVSKIIIKLTTDSLQPFENTWYIYKLYLWHHKYLKVCFLKSNLAIVSMNNLFNNHDNYQSKKKKELRKVWNMIAQIWIFWEKSKHTFLLTESRVAAFNLLEIVFCYQNYSDLLWEKIVQCKEMGWY